MNPKRCREAVVRLVSSHEARTYDVRVVEQSRSTQAYDHNKKGDELMTAKQTQELVLRQSRYVIRRIHRLLVRERGVFNVGRSANP